MNPGGDKYMDFDRKVFIQEAIDEIIHRLQASGKFIVAIEEIENFLGTELEKNEIAFITEVFQGKGIKVTPYTDGDSNKKHLEFTEMKVVK